jgi:signal transduction histidine kinase
MRPLQHLFDRLTLTTQMLASGLTFSAAAAGASWATWPDQPHSAWGVLGGGALVTAMGALLARRVTLSVQSLAQAARVLAREDAPEDATLPYKSATAELHDATLALRRAVDLARQQRLALTARNAALGVKLQTRTQELTSLQDLSIGLAHHNDVASLVAEALGALQQTMNFASASVWSRVGMQAKAPVVLMGYRSQETPLAGVQLADLTGLRLSRANLQRYEQIERDALPIIENSPRQGLLNWLWAMVTDDARTSELYRSTKSWMAVPLKVRERVLGVLRVDHGEPDYFDRERTRLLGAVGSQTALAMRHAHLLAEERDVAVVAERNRIARELHDAVSQTLFAANLVAGTLARAAAVDDATRQQAITLERLNRSALAEMRMLLFELRPDALADARLSELLQHAVEALAGRGDIDISTDLASDGGPPTAQRVQLYRIAQAALSNIARHSGALHVHVSWAVPRPGYGVLRIADDGRGFDAALPREGHFGVDNIQDRAAELGATLAFNTAPGQGTEIKLELTWS